MYLFSQIALPLPGDLYSGVRLLVEAVTARHQAHGLSRENWSLAELGVDEEDYRLLCLFVAVLPASATRALLESTTETVMNTSSAFCERDLTYRSGLGLLLLLVCTESARRFAPEGELWPHALRPFSGTERDQKALRNLLFDANHQPLSLFKAVVRSAAQTFCFRHVLNQQEAGVALHWWFTTLKMQYGFSDAVVTQGDKIAQYLDCNGGSDAIKHLLYGLPTQDQCPGAAERSASFRYLFLHLKQFRKTGDASELRARLRYCLWIPPCGIAELEKAARRRREGGLVQSTNHEEDPGLLEEPPLVAQWGLCWDGVDPPILRLCLDATRLDNVLEEAACVQVVSKTIADVFRQPDGKMLPLARSGFAPNPLLAPYLFHVPFEGTSDVSVALVSPGNTPNAETLLSETIAVYVPQNEVCVFDASGTPLSVEQSRFLLPGRPYLLWLGEDLELRVSPPLPFPPAIRPLGKSGAALGTLVRLPANWHGTLAAVFPDMEDEPIWTSGIGEKAVIEAREPDWADGCKCALKPVTNQPRFLGIHVTLPQTPSIGDVAAVSVVRVRFAGRSTTIPCDEIWGAASPAMLPANVAVDVWLQRLGEKPTRIRRVCPHIQNGIAYRQNENVPGGWLLCDPTKTLMAQTIAGKNLRVWAYPQWKEAQHGYLFEGNRSLGPVRLETGSSRQMAVAARFLSPSGWGGPLTLRRRRFNATEPAVALAKAVADYGILSRAESTDTGLSLGFSQPVRFSNAQHRVHLWDAKGAETILNGDQINVVSDTQWSISVPVSSCEAWGVVAVSFDGVRRGARPLFHFSQILPLWAAAEVPALETAALLRWLHLPLLRRDIRPAVSRWRDQNGPMVIWAWLTGSGLPAHLRFSPGDEWASVLCDLVGDWNPSGKEARQLLALLSPTGNPAINEAARVREPGETSHRIGSALADLLEVSPGLALTVMRVYWREVMPVQCPDWTAQSRKKFADAIQNAVLRVLTVRHTALLGDMKETHALGTIRAHLLQGACRALGNVDENFVLRSLLIVPPENAKKEQKEWWENNVGYALEYPEFRVLCFLEGYKSIVAG